MEFLWDTQMLDTRTTMKGRYEKNESSCPQCKEGRKEGVLETPSHLLGAGRAGRRKCWRLPPTSLVQGGGSVGYSLPPP